MDVYLVDQDGAHAQDPALLPHLLEDGQGVVWVDVSTCDQGAADTLRRVFGFHELALHDCRVRNHVAKIHAYPDHVFTVLHAPQIGQRGHVHYIELDQFLGPNYLVTVHGPLNPVVDPAVAHIDTGRVLARCAPASCGRPPASSCPRRSSGRCLATRSTWSPSWPNTRASSSSRWSVPGRRRGRRGIPQRTVPGLVRAARDPHDRRAQQLDLRPHGAHGTVPPAEETPVAADLADGFDMVASMADGQREFLHGVIEYFQTRISTHLAISSDDLPRSRCSRTTTCARSPPGSPSSPYPPPSPASSARTSPIQGSAPPPASSRRA